MMQPPTLPDRILIIDDIPGIDAEVTTALKEENCPVERVNSGVAALARLEEGFDLLITPDVVDGESVLSTLATVQRRFPHTGVLVVTTPDGADRDAAALDVGAADYLVTPSSPTHTMAVIRRALKLRRMRSELSTLRQTVAMAHGFDNLVGLSEPMVKLKETARKLAPTDITLLITGPAGSGKELLARVMHHHSRRRCAAFVAVDFSALPEALVAEMLFGRDASRANDIITLSESAHGGTLFLDNIEAVPLSLQARLAQFLKDFTIVAGDGITRRKIAVRIIASANHDPAEKAAEGHYDAELYRLLSEIKLALPPLSKRVEDIELLTDYFLRRRATELGDEPVRVSRETLDKLSAYGWPGNVRELENCLRRAVALCPGDELLPQDISFFGPADDVAVVRERHILTTKRSGGRLADTQRSIITRALEDNDWNFTQTAQELGIGRTTLWRKVKKYQLKRESVEMEA